MFIFRSKTSIKLLLLNIEAPFLNIFLPRTHNEKNRR